MCFNHAWLLLVSFVLGQRTKNAVSAFYLFSYGNKPNQTLLVHNSGASHFPHAAHTHTYTRTRMHTQSNVSEEDTGSAP